MFACACGQLTSAWEEKPCTDCGHFAYYHDEEENEETSKFEHRQNEIVVRIEEDKLRVKFSQEAKKKSMDARLKEEKMFAIKMDIKYKTGLDRMTEDGGYLADCERQDLKNRRNSKKFRKNQKGKKFIDILNIREFHQGKQLVSLILIIKN